METCNCNRSGHHRFTRWIPRPSLGRKKVCQLATAWLVRLWWVRKRVSPQFTAFSWGEHIRADLKGVRNWGCNEYMYRIDSIFTALFWHVVEWVKWQQQQHEIEQFMAETFSSAPIFSKATYSVVTELNCVWKFKRIHLVVVENVDKFFGLFF